MSFGEQIAQYVVSGLTTGAVYALVALGFCLIYNATRIVNFAQGDFLSLGGLMAYTFLTGAGLPMILAFPCAVVSVALVGALLERLAIRPAKSRQVMVLIFITIAASILMRGIFKHLWGKEALALPPLSPEVPLKVLGATLTPQNLWVLGMTLAAIVALLWFFNRTLTGKAMRATAINPSAAALMGIDANRMTMYSFGLAGGLGALAGVLITPITSLSYEVGVIMGLKGFAAAVLGGYGSFVGAILGGLVLGLIESLTAGLVSSVYKDAVAFVVLLLVLFLRPGGLMGVKSGDRV
ncbi:MAG: branched-chain amino acid ABC transporter permease [Desulfarculaceae bacterium]|nr:branched-chain amino acid ABC transporter permease [Desulfarculaceae bacterium]MCF8071302.1 branched-chain amino acid ABC transporter permease [Desulfarculaceae bacterium]MCF8101627.1 branched-chain amino acid ABC transporter permease [Desulfarculaceae bacterium]MCF8117433.1 branched-chain amino acid ABC transporter permease [Desulfarculaceae bacterium]